VQSVDFELREQRIETLHVKAQPSWVESPPFSASPICT
jgi:hypothetical protein